MRFGLTGRFQWLLGLCGSPFPSLLQLLQQVEGCQIFLQSCSCQKFVTVGGSGFEEHFSNGQGPEHISVRLGYSKQEVSSWRLCASSSWVLVARILWPAGGPTVPGRIDGRWLRESNRAVSRRLGRSREGLAGPFQPWHPGA